MASIARSSSSAVLGTTTLVHVIVPSKQASITTRFGSWGRSRIEITTTNRVDSCRSMRSSSKLNVMELTELLKIKNCTLSFPQIAEAMDRPDCALKVQPERGVLLIKALNRYKRITKEEADYLIDRVRTEEFQAIV